MIHPDTELRYINSIIGYGVCATKLIPEGTITWVQDELDTRYSPEAVSRLSPEILPHIEKYCFVNNLGEKILCWDHAKYVNHSFKPSCLSTAYDFEIAIRDIYPGEQLTDDYGYLNVEEPFDAVDEGTIRKTVYPDDLLHYSKDWDAKILERMPLILSQNQPLKKHLTSSVWETLERVSKGEIPLKSIQSCYYKPGGK